MNFFSREITSVFEKWIELCANSVEQNETFLLTTQQYRIIMTSQLRIFFELNHLDFKNAIKFLCKINNLTRECITREFEVEWGLGHKRRSLGLLVWLKIQSTRLVSCAVMTCGLDIYWHTRHRSWSLLSRDLMSQRHYDIKRMRSPTYLHVHSVNTNTDKFHSSFHQ